MAAPFPDHVWRPLRTRVSLSRRDNQHEIDGNAGAAASHGSRLLFRWFPSVRSSAMNSILGEERFARLSATKVAGGQRSPRARSNVAHSPDIAGGCRRKTAK